MRVSNWRFWGLCAGGCLLSILTGCASVTHGTSQQVKIETLTADGKVVDGAECRVFNDKAEATVPSGSSVTVRRSGATLSIECKQAGQLPANGQATSRVNAGMVGNVLIGGLIGAAIDSGTGAGFNYPSWMQLVFGELRLFDRSAQVDEQALAGVRMGMTETAVASAAPAVPAAMAERAVGGAVISPPSATVSSAAGATRVSMDDLRGLLPAKP
jgi:hypothetical protein